MQLDIGRTSAYKQYFPGIIIAICSAWDGSIFCAEVEDLPIQKGRGAQNLNLLDEYWQPIWKYFPLVKRGERLKQIWNNLRESMEGFGTRQVAPRRDDKLWDGEYESLTRYLAESWTEDLESLGIQRPESDGMTLEELWQKAREISGAMLAGELLRPSDDNLIESNTMILAMRRALGRRGEESISIHLPSLAEELGMDADGQSLVAVAGLLAGLLKPSDDERHKKLVSRVVRELPDGFGEVFLLDQGVSFEHTEPIDLRTAIMLMTNPCRIDR